MKVVQSSAETHLSKLSYILRFHRRLRSISQIEMSELLQMSPRNYQRLENGEVEPQLSTLSKICHVLKIPITVFANTNELNIYDLREVATADETTDFLERQKISTLNEDIQFIKNIIAADCKGETAQMAMRASVKANKAFIDDQLRDHYFKSDSSEIEIDQYLIGKSCVEIWETVFRLKLNRVIVENAYLLPVGFKVFQEFHYDVNPNIENPTSECFMRDITDRRALEYWLRSHLNTRNF